VVEAERAPGAALGWAGARGPAVPVGAALAVAPAEGLAGTRAARGPTEGGVEVRGTVAAALGLAGIRAPGEPGATGDAGAGVPPLG
jgi:hypothetical protein